MMLRFKCSVLNFQCIVINCFTSNYTENGINYSEAVIKRFDYISRVMRKLDFCICENKGAYQLRGNREAD